MRILFVNPNVLNPPVFPLGMDYTAEYLSRQGCDLVIVDLNVQKLPGNLPPLDLALVTIRNLDSGEGNTSTELFKIKTIIDKIRRRYNVNIAIGGSAVNILPEELRRFLDVEYALVSKGFGAVEKLISNIADGIRQPGVIKDYSTYIKGRFQRNAVDKRFYIDNSERIGIVTKFGCLLNCQYCNYPAIDGNAIEKRDPDHIVDEILNLKEQGVRKIFFCDSNFNIPVGHAIEILDRLLSKDIRIDWDGFNNPHPAFFTKDYAERLACFDFSTVHFGIDSLSDAVLEDTRKGFTVADVYNAVDLCRAHGMDVSCSLLFGHPAENAHTVDETFRHIDRMNFSYVDVSRKVRIYPFTQLQQIAIRQGYIKNNETLLHPFFYPVDNAVEERIDHWVHRNDNCHAPSYQQYR
jgi:radical SAM superfamily enzyme YgiQ (UPF0313 family)